MEKICDRIIKMRKIWRLSSNQVAECIGLSLNDYESLESGNVSLDIKIAMKLCELFKITLDYLMTGEISEKDKKAINRPLTKEEILFDETEKIKALYSEEIFNKFYKYLYAIYIDRNDKKNGIYFGDSNGNKDIEGYLKLNNYDFLSELSKNGVFDLHYVKKTNEHIKSKNINDVLSFDLVLKLMQEGTLTDHKFINYAVKTNPVKVLNYYYLRDGIKLDKQGILKCIEAGGYIEKIVEAHYYRDYSRDWDDDESAVEYIKGKDVFLTLLLREYCSKND